jgi:putative tricarboxylic transport membrane protein
VKVLTIPQGVLAAIVIMFCLVGAFADRNTISDMWMIVIFGTLAVLFERYRFPVSPMVLGAILGPLAEDSYMRSMITYHRDWTVFFTQPIAGSLMVLSIISLSYPVVRSLLARRREMATAAQYPDL